MNAPERFAGKGAELSSRLIDILLSGGGYAVTLVEAYFDESGSHSGSPVLCVAGYLMTKEQAQTFTREWQAVLDQFHLPYFRMSQCAPGNGPFKALSKRERTWAAAQMIGVIKRNVTLGVATTVNMEEHEAIMAPLPVGGPYTSCARMCMVAVQEWIRQNNYQGRVAYIFESGHASMAETNAIMAKAFSIFRKSDEYRYLSHMFADKKAMLPLQAADLLAWQWFTDMKHQMTGKPRRKDCASLLETAHYSMHLTGEMMNRMVATWRAELAKGRRFMDGT